MTRIVVCDTGPLLHLSEAGAIHLLSLAGEILIPSLVAIEVETNAQVEVRHSRIYRVEVHGSIGILLWSVATGHVRDKVLAFHLLDNLVISSLWVSERVLQEARKAIITLCK